MSTLSRYRGIIGNHPQAVFRWEQTSRHHYQLLSGSDVHGTLVMSLEPSILFSPNHCEFYRAAAEVNDKEYFCKCVFLDGEFRGCLLTNEDLGQPLALFEERSSNFMWCRRSRIVLCADGTVWPWVRGGDNGQWILRDGVNRILEVKSTAPDGKGSVRVYSSSFLQSQYSRAMILFCVYLAMEPKHRLTSPA